MGKTGEYTTTRMGGLKHHEMNIFCRQYEGESCRMNGPLIFRGDTRGFLDQKWNKSHDVTGFIQLASKAHLQCVTRVCQIQADTYLLVVYHFGGRATTPHTKGQLVFFLLQMCLYVLPQVAGHWKTGH